MSDHRATARAILSANDRGGYTVPTDRLYPFQWNWDSAFVAMGLAGYDIDRALTELERLIGGQWPDGMIPHIVFHQPSDSYFPGPDLWRVAQRVATSGITQPPVFAMALKMIADRLPGDDRRAAPQQNRYPQRLRALFDAALRYQRWWYRSRDPDGTGLVALLHPWESGSDNSPAWDLALERVPTTTKSAVIRKDIGHVDAQMRPRDSDYQRFIHLVDAYAETGWDPVQQWQIAPFKVACVQTTAILLRAGEALADLAGRFGLDAEAAELQALNARSRAALLGSWSPNHARFLSLDLVSQQRIAAPTQSGFIPLLALDLAPEMAGAAVEEMRRWCRGLKVIFPTSPADAPGFEARRYWRGPVWPIINWLLIMGLQRNDQVAFADEIRRSVIDAIEHSGFCEYFDPITAEPCGGDRFSWSAATYLALTGPPHDREC